MWLLPRGAGLLFACKHSAKNLVGAASHHLYLLPPHRASLPAAQSIGVCPRLPPEGSCFWQRPQAFYRVNVQKQGKGDTCVTRLHLRLQDQARQIILFVLRSTRWKAKDLEPEVTESWTTGSRLASGILFLPHKPGFASLVLRCARHYGLRNAQRAGHLVGGSVSPGYWPTHSLSITAWAARLPATTPSQHPPPPPPWRSESEASLQEGCFGHPEEKLEPALHIA